LELDGRRRPPGNASAAGIEARIEAGADVAAAGSAGSPPAWCRERDRRGGKSGASATDAARAVS
jgi:hypothetical protein